jgi:hypothetical protein
MSMFHNGDIGFGLNSATANVGGCSQRRVKDGRWHHLAITRQAASGTLRLYIDGQQEFSVAGSTGNVSYRSARPGGLTDPYLVLGGEKHGLMTYEGFPFLPDEFRISNIVRSTAPFTPRTTDFVSDANTMGLYHFNEGTGAVAVDAVGGLGFGQRRESPPVAYQWAQLRQRHALLNSG